MSSRRLSLGLLLAAALAMAACSSGDAGAAASAANESSGLPDSVEAIALTPITAGEDTSRLGDLMDSRPMVVNFFAAWCAPCIEEMPDFETVYQDLGDHVAFIGLAIDGRDQAQRVIDQTGVTYPTYLDNGADAFAFFDAIDMPTTVFLDPDGEILEIRSRPLTEGQLRDMIHELFWS